MRSELFRPQCSSIHFIPERLQSPDNMKEIFEGLFKLMPDYPMDGKGGAPSTYQFLESWLSSNPCQWSLTDPYFRAEASGSSTKWRVNPRILDVLVTAINLLQLSLNNSFDFLAAMADISRYSVDPEAKCEKLLRSRETLPALSFADMLYKDRVEKGLEHVKTHLLLHTEGTVEPPTPSLPPPSRADTPIIQNHLAQVWVKGYAGMPSTLEE
jgi:hypothetical protein